ncbi:sulfatase [Maribacter sp. HTCC2170]|uniref:sulfatase family protein n=1 Tax=Maribacter sp. (strain HTCC2170 / KCCM 42371) TaxID=313603 RepID=UPI0005A2BFC5|nr:sulfatase-like hydrolase/transferase [Maribacter sp. HTCC2170]
MKNLVKLVCLILLGITSCKSPDQKPNIILIMTDDQGWNDVGFNGNTQIQTPMLDQLAAGGVIFDRFYSASAVCSPTRASVITGRNPLRMNIPDANSGHMLPEEITLPELLKGQGYATGHFGKWHLGTLTKDTLDANRGGREKFDAHYSLPTEHGYDEFFSTESKVPTYDPMIYPENFDEGESLRYGWRSVESNEGTKPYGTAYWTGENQKVTTNIEGDNSRVIMDRVLPFIDRAITEEKPFFSTLWLHTPHLPVVSDSAHRSLYPDLDLQQQIYNGTLTAMDEQIGRLWSKLEALDIQENTIIFFCSDNGPENDTPGSAGVFRERKRSLYEGGVRVPAFMVWKNHVTGGQRSYFPSVTSDYLPTLLDILNITYPDNRPVDGESLWEVVQGEEKARENPIGFIYKQKLSWVDNQYKLIRTSEDGPFELYDLIDDPSETKNIIQDQPEIGAKMKQALFAWRETVEQSAEGKDYK